MFKPYTHELCLIFRDSTLRRSQQKQHQPLPSCTPPPPAPSVAPPAAAAPTPSPAQQRAARHGGGCGEGSGAGGRGWRTGDGPLDPDRPQRPASHRPRRPPVRWWRRGSRWWGWEKFSHFSCRGTDIMIAHTEKGLFVCLLSFLLVCCLFLLLSFCCCLLTYSWPWSVLFF